MKLPVLTLGKLKAESLWRQFVAGVEMAIALLGRHPLPTCAHYPTGNQPSPTGLLVLGVRASREGNRALKANVRVGRSAAAF